jgi:hypothetical protein
MSPASISTNKVDASNSALSVRKSEVLPTPDGPMIRALAPLFSASLSSAVMIFMARPR